MKRRRKKAKRGDFDFVGTYESVPKRPKMLKLGAVCKTAGNGLWSDEERSVKVLKATIRGFMPEYPSCGDLRVKFSIKTWNTDKHGLIYTDTLWLREFKQLLESRGFSKKAVNEVDYSEQGMQGNDYVSLDIDKRFLKEWRERGLTVGEFR